VSAEKKRKIAGNQQLEAAVNALGQARNVDSLIHSTLFSHQAVVVLNF
jgi:hypothetical protein